MIVPVSLYCIVLYWFIFLVSCPIVFVLVFVLHCLLTPCRRDAAIGAVKIVFRPPAFQLLYSANARVNTVKEGLPWLLYIW